MFLPEPRPERICKLIHNKDESLPTKGPVLSVGLQIVTETCDGLKIVPTKQIVFAIGTEENPEEKIFEIPPIFARAMAGRLVEFADAAEAQ